MAAYTLSSRNVSDKSASQLSPSPKGSLHSVDLSSPGSPRRLVKNDSASPKPGLSVNAIKEDIEILIPQLGDIQLVNLITSFKAKIFQELDRYQDQKIINSIQQAFPKFQLFYEHQYDDALPVIGEFITELVGAPNDQPLVTTPIERHKQISIPPNKILLALSIVIGWMSRCMSTKSDEKSEKILFNDIPDIIATYLHKDRITRTQVFSLYNCICFLDDDRNSKIYDEFPTYTVEQAMEILQDLLVSDASDASPKNRIPEKREPPTEGIWPWVRTGGQLALWSAISALLFTSASAN